MIAGTVRYMPVDSCREPDSAGLRCTSHPANSAPRDPENTPGQGPFPLVVAGVGFEPT